MPRLSYSSVVATLALVVALTGTSVAATNLLNGSKIKPNSIPGNRVKKHSLTAKQINLAKLGTISHAATADQAMHATTSDNVGGLTAAALQPNTRVLVGAGDPKTVPAETIIDSPLGFRIQTDGIAGYDRTITLVNKTSENWSVISTSGAGTLIPNASDVIHQGNSPLAVTDSNEVQFLLQAIPLPRRDALVDCWFPGAGGAETLITCTAAEVGA